MLRALLAVPALALCLAACAPDGAPAASNSASLDTASAGSQVVYFEIDQRGGMPWYCKDIPGGKAPYVWRSLTVIDAENDRITRQHTDPCQGPRPEVVVHHAGAAALAAEGRALAPGKFNGCASDAPAIELRATLGDGSTARRGVAGNECNPQGADLADKQAYEAFLARVNELLSQP